jgi:hypothetical protein
MVPTFNANKKCKLSLVWFKHVDIKNLNNNGVGKFEAPSHNTPKYTFFDVREVHFLVHSTLVLAPFTMSPPACS